MVSQSICAITRRANCVPIFSPRALPVPAYFRHSTSANLSIFATPSWTSILAASPLCEWSVESLNEAFSAGPTRNGWTVTV